jgi:hypothetical protein
MAKLPWVERKFVFEFPVETWPDVVERFRGLPARIEDKIRGLSREALTWSDGGWSIQENIGHLLELESVFGRRIDDFLAGKPILSAADMSNRATADADFARVSEHPRLKQKLRLIDAITFVCLHDDYHLARMTEIAKKYQAR